jgi:chromosome partitioning protein
MITLAFVHPRRGAGTTTVVHHLAAMFADQGVCTLAVDLDPQAELSDRLRPDGGARSALLSDALGSRLSGGPAAGHPPLQATPVADHLHLLAGDLGLTRLDDPLAAAWAAALRGDPAGLRAFTVLPDAVRGAAAAAGAALALVDLGPNLGPLHRAALLGADHLVFPVADTPAGADALALLGGALHGWRASWAAARRAAGAGSGGPPPDLPPGELRPLGYILHEVHSAASASPVPAAYQRDILDAPPPGPEPELHRLAALRPYRSLMPLAQSAGKPMFRLRPADGARGAHIEAVAACHADFLGLARALADRLHLPLG